MINKGKKFKRPIFADSHNWTYYPGTKVLKPYYKPRKYDKTLVFESRFESGNLDMVYKHNMVDYDLLL